MRQQKNRILLGLALSLMATGGCQNSQSLARPPVAAVVDVGDRGGGSLLIGLNQGLRTKYVTGDISNLRYRIYQNDELIHSYETTQTTVRFDNVPIGAVTVKVMAFVGSTPINRDDTSDEVPDEAVGTATVVSGTTTDVTIDLYLAGGTGDVLAKVQLHEMPPSFDDIAGSTLGTVPLTATALGVIGSPVNVSAHGSAQNDPAIAYNPIDHEYLVIWLEDSGSQKDIVAQRLASDGTTTGSRLVLDTSTDSQFLPTVACNIYTGEYLVAWSKGPWGNSGIMRQILYADGTAKTSVSRISNGSAYQYKPMALFNPSQNRFVVAWYQWGNAWDVTSRIIYPNDVPDWSDQPIYNGSGDQYDAWLAADASGNLMAVWHDYRSGSSDIYARRFDNGMYPLTNDILISSASNNQEYAKIAYRAANDEFLVVWNDLRAGNLDIYGQRLTSMAVTIGSELAIVTDSATQERPKVAYQQKSDSFLVMWDDWRGTGTEPDVYARRIDPQGGTYMPSAFNLTALSNWQLRPDLLYNPDKDLYFAVWQSFSPGNWDIFSQYIR